MAFVGSEAGEAARVAAGDLPAELCIVGFLGRTVNVQDRLTFCIDERGCFERLNAVIRPAAVVLADVFAVKNVSSMAA